MCGIAGFADAPRSDARAPRNEADFALVHRMCEVIRHRGPDDEGIHVEPGVGLGMRRLSIIDLSTGHQPIHNEDRSCGSCSTARSTTTASCAPSSKPPGITSTRRATPRRSSMPTRNGARQRLARLRGMFGIALWDRRTPHAAARTRSCRDQAAAFRRAWRPAVFRFGDQIAHRRRRCRPRRSISKRSTTTCRFCMPRAIDRCSRVCVSCRLVIFCVGATVERRSSSTGKSVPRSRSVGASRRPQRRCARVLADAVRSHMVSDVPLGAFLSGGVDSSIVVGLMAEASSRPVQTFSIGFDEPAFDELEHARRVATHFGTEHHEFVVRPDGVSILDRLVEHFDEPFADSSAIPDLVCLGDCTPSRHRGVVGRWRRRAVRRLRPLPAASAGGAVRPMGAARRARARWRGRGRGFRTARAARISCATSRATTDGRYLDSVAFFQQDEKPRLVFARRAPVAAAVERREMRLASGSPVSTRCRRTAG